MPFLPAVDQRPAPISSGGNYFKPQDGKNKVRILSEAVIGYSYWNQDNKPVRLREYPDSRPSDIRLKDDGSGKVEPIKLFWAMVVWDYAAEALKVWEVTQASIQEQIEALYDNEDWGDPVGYDLTINRAGKKLDTTYTIQPSPQKAVSGAILRAYREANIDLNALFSGGNPFEGGPAAAPSRNRRAILLEALNQKGLKWDDVAEALPSFGASEIGELTETNFDAFIEMIQAWAVEEVPVTPPPPARSRAVAKPASVATEPDFDDIPF